MTAGRMCSFFNLKNIVGTRRKRGHKGTSGAAKEAEINNEMLRLFDLNQYYKEVGVLERKKEEFISN